MTHSLIHIADMADPVLTPDLVVARLGPPDAAYEGEDVLPGLVGGLLHLTVGDAAHELQVDARGGCP